jgi:hypothetical protein
MVSDVKTKLRISARAQEILQEFQGEGELNLLVDLLFTFLGGKKSTKVAESTVGVKQQKKLGKKTPKVAEEGKSSTAQAVVPKTTTTSTDASEEKEEIRTIKPVECSPDDEGAPNFVKCILSDCARAKRATGSIRPRMDHKSIMSRCKTLRKKLRRSFHEVRDREEDDLKIIMTFVNLVKSFRLLFRDAFQARCELNIGVELYNDFFDVDYFEGLALVLEMGGLDKSEQTLYWQDSSGKLPQSSSPGAERDIRPNPFET